MLQLATSDLDGFISRIKDEYDLFDIRRDALPPKKYFFPPEEITFIVKEGKAPTVPTPPKPFLLFGLSLNDLRAITDLDEIMRSPEPDHYYFRRRERAILIGLTKERFNIAPGGDLIFQGPFKGGYEVTALTDKGKAVIKKHGRGLVKKTTESVKARAHKDKTMQGLKLLLRDPELLKDAVQWSWLGYKKAWDRLATECMGCGVCTYVCPLCHCFSIEDSVELSGKDFARCRKWDACTLPEFAKVAGGGDFHKDIKERYYNWYYHKFVRGYLEFGKSQCTACGRCARECPARIDIEEVLLDIVGSYKASLKKGARR